MIFHSDKNTRYIYSKRLQYEIKKTSLIPRLINDSEHCKLYHKYWLSNIDSIAKVIDIQTIDKQEYYFFKYCEGKYSICASYPLDFDQVYEMLHSNGLEDLNIINSNISYTGAEIKFWFIANDIDLTSKEYSGFWAFLNTRSKNPIIDNKYYFVSYKQNRKQKCQIILDKNKL